jgi:hypothetical protein
LATVTINVENPTPSNLSGIVYFDTNNNGSREAGEHAFGGIEVTLTGTTVFGESVQQTTTTTANGAYAFSQLVAGDYVVTQEQPAIVVDGIDSIGGETSSTNNSFVVELGSATTLTDLNFGERGLQAMYIGNPLFMSSRIQGGAGIGIGPDGTTSWYCLDGGWSTMRSVSASLSADRSSVTITAVDQAGNVLANTVPVDHSSVVVRGNAANGYFVRLNAASSAFGLQALPSPAAESVDAVFAE